MIVGKRKPFDEIKKALIGYSRILIVGCGECVTVCHAGGEKEVKLLASQLELNAVATGVDIRVDTAMVERQCDPEFLEDLTDKIREAEIVVTLGCGAGAQTLSKTFPEIAVIPGLNTRFIGAHTAESQWDERCSGCGDCSIHLFGGYCPITRCPKNLLNGPCGGSRDGHCELNPEADCIWHLIIERMTALGRLEELLEYRPPKDWQTSRAGGPRRQKLEGSEK